QRRSITGNSRLRPSGAIPDASGVGAATVSSVRAPLGPASRLGRRYAEAPTGCAAWRAFGAGRSSTALPAASKSGLLAAFIFQGDRRFYVPRTQRGHASLSRETPTFKL